jgi:CRISPR type III-B/RAMP module RAMP protein Cmr1
LIKGSLRFWFRALHGHFAKVEDLQAEERKYFGDTSRKSPLLIRCKPDGEPRIERLPLLPHRTDNRRSPAQAILPGSRFTVQLTTPTKQLEKINALFELAIFLGGWGRRSRRAAGCIKIVSTQSSGQESPSPYKAPDNLEALIELLQEWTPYYSVQEDKIQFLYSGQKLYYPWLNRIELGNQSFGHEQDLRSRIGKVTSNLKHHYDRAYEVSMGHAFKGRFASPVYTSAFEQAGSFYAVVSTLNTIPDRDPRLVNLYIQDDFKREVL